MILKLIFSQKFKMNIYFHTLKPADSIRVKILITKAFKICYPRDLIWNDFSIKIT